MIGGAFAGSWVWKLNTLPRIKTFFWQCLHNSIGVGKCLVKSCLSLISTLYALRNLKLFCTDLGTVRCLEVLEVDWESMLPATSMREVWFTGWRRIVRIVLAE